MEEERKSIIPFEHLFMSQDGLKTLLEKTRPADEEIKVTITPLDVVSKGPRPESFESPSDDLNIPL
jgi:hypothetical protein